ncbi:MAG: LamG domain-containing protein, partial [Deltaproteobacteria bacterium]
MPTARDTRPLPHAMLAALLLAPGLLAPGVAAASGNQLALDGEDDFAALGFIDPGDAFTFETWIDATWDTGEGNYDTVVEAIDTTTYYNAFFLGKVEASWTIEVNQSDIYEGNSCTEDDVLCTPWSGTIDGMAHLAVTVDSTEIRFYINGELVATQDISGPASFDGELWVLGADYDGAGVVDELNGALDEVRIWNSARTIEEIQCTMDYALTGSEPGIVARYGMDDAAGSTTVTDSSSDAYHGTLYDDADFETSVFGLTESVGGDIPCFDFDGDGATPDDGDCDDTDPSIHPGATETWYDGVDQDCDGESDYDADGDGH